MRNPVSKILDLDPLLSYDGRQLSQEMTIARIEKMAELVWKGKNGSNRHPADRHGLQTCEGFGGRVKAGATLSTTDDWHNRLIVGDKAVVLPALLHEFANGVDLIYIDPPFMTGRNFASYSDRWSKDLDAYLQWLYETLILLHQLLANDGSLYVHLDWRTTHYARIILDEVFGFAPNAEGPGFKNEIIWHYQSGGRSRRSYARKHDTLLLYSKSAEYCFHGERIGERRGHERRNHMRKQVGDDGQVQWTIHSAGKLYTYDENNVLTPSDVWCDISHLQQKDPERNGYATQKPAALLERVILASSEENDLVLDCFCGSGVTPVVAEQLGRRWIACDQNPEAIQVTRERLLGREELRPFVVQAVALQIDYA
jgi:site-specific DNA-methyltransferase (adenine-specific)